MLCVDSLDETLMQSMTIGALAKQAGVAIDTVRYYERAGLLPAAARRASGYRAFRPETVQRLRFIRRAKDLGFTLEEIGELLALSGQRERGVKGVKFAATAKLHAVENKLRELQRIRGGLRALIAACPGHGPLDECPILKALSSGASA